MRRFYFLGLVAPALVGIAATGIAQQHTVNILGRVVSAAVMATPIDGATVQLLDAVGEELPNIVHTNKAGSFFMQVEPGRYGLKLRRVGFQAITVAAFDINEGQDKNMVLRAYPTVMQVASVRTTAHPNVERGRDGMEARKGSEKGGVFLFRQDIVKTDQGFMPDIFRNVDGLKVTAGGVVESTKGWRCLVWMVNRVPVKSYPLGRPDTATFNTLEDLVPDSRDIMGVEIYRQLKEVPAIFLTTAWPTDLIDPRPVSTQTSLMPVVTSNQLGGCGLINIWTIAAW